MIDSSYGQISGHTAFDTPPLPEGYTKHHIVFLEAIHLDLPKLDFEYTIDRYSATPDDKIAERIKPATIIVSNVAKVLPEHLEQAPHVQLIAIYATGMGWVDHEYMARRNITVCNCPGANIPSVSEHFLALYFASRKRIPVVDRIVKESDQWLRTSSVNKSVWPQGPPLGCTQETLGIIGYGALGKRIEQLAKGLMFNKILIAERRGASEIRAGRTPFEDVIRTATTIVTVCPRDKNTVDLISEAELRQMQPTALVINMARGGIVNEAALAKALKEGWIFGAAADVLDTEPGGPGTTPLLPDVGRGEEPVPGFVISSHVSWFSGSTIETLQGIMKIVLEGFVRGTLLQSEGSRRCISVLGGKVYKTA